MAAPETVLPENIRKHVESVERLPPLPRIVHEILALRARDTTDAAVLAQIVELDPSLSAQVVRYARSALYNYQGKIASAEQAVARVLGYDLVMNLALGLAAATPFKLPRRGPLGATAYWKHSVRTAVMSQRLARLPAIHAQFNGGLAYLSGLLHDFGLLVINHLYPRDFASLNDILSGNPDNNILDVENALMGVTHCQLGAWLLHRWQLPHEVVIASLKHHDEDYKGVQAEYAQLNFLSNRILDIHTRKKTVKENDIPSAPLQRLGLDPVQVTEEANRVIDQYDGLESLINRLAA